MVLTLRNVPKGVLHGHGGHIELLRRRLEDLWGDHRNVMARIIRVDRVRVRATGIRHSGVGLRIIPDSVAILSKRIKSILLVRGHEQLGRDPAAYIPDIYSFCCT
jgi:hypothetical protein